ncbi:voltage-gated chloride channel protein [Paenibacillus albicereus]|uniref:Voltage-gated chloride channel protein n=1 Tax=Paenibacillus albicereus TaxID=2726185 RepID=A0A6H2H247_9BACL|nr:chloride channel protein [Paenibacillus albicereus]QJC53732.1 voltage-gated chloride channel protein [Paenibacillus albicereus]
MGESKSQNKRLREAGMGMAGIAAFLLKWLALGSLVGALAGSASALLLWSLELATDTRMAHPWLLALLPAAGFFVSWTYRQVGGSAIRGSNLILESIHEGRERIPLRMAPLVLGGTVLTHLTGGSAGREGTAVQMGGSLAWLAGTLVRSGADDRRILLLCGMAGGFGSVFGTPLAGALFGVEVLAIGLLRHGALYPCLVAALVGDAVTRAWGIGHAVYPLGEVPPESFAALAAVALAAVAFGLAARLFIAAVHGVRRLATRLVPSAPWRSAAGGTVIALLALLVGGGNYLGLSLPLLQDSFAPSGSIEPFDWLGKLLFTALTLGTGFQGGEVTPLFVIGSTLGHALAPLLQLPAPLLAGLGLVGVFSAAANTPLACFVLGLELFGADAAAYLLVASVIAYLCSGTASIYSSQRRTYRKDGRDPAD